MDKIKPTRNASGHFPIMHSESGDADNFTGQTVNSFVSSVTLSLKIGGGGGVSKFLFLLHLYGLYLHKSR